MALLVEIQKDANPLIVELDRVVKNLKKELRIVSWKAANKGESLIAKEVTKELNTAQRNVKAQITRKRVSSSTGSKLILAKSARIPLRDFKARQIKSGVSYKISKTRGRKRIPGAFIIKKFGGHVFKRENNDRGSIYKPAGVSPWGIFVVNKLQRQVTPKINQEVHKQLAERLRYQTLKKSGAI